MSDADKPYTISDLAPAERLSLILDPNRAALLADAIGFYHDVLVRRHSLESFSPNGIRDTMAHMERGYMLVGGPQAAHDLIVEVGNQIMEWLHGHINTDLVDELERRLKAERDKLT